MHYLEFIFNSQYLLVLAAVLLPLLLSLRFYPTIILVVRSKNLMDEPGDRSAHTHKTPTLGGVVAFIAFALSLVLLALPCKLGIEQLLQLLTILAATLILMSIGVKDDLIGLSPLKKFGMQAFAAALCVLFIDLRILSFQGLFGLYELPYIASILLTVFVFMLVINAFNLIDGIDGLAGTIGIVCSLAFGGFFFLNQRQAMILVSFTLVGALIGFLCFNTSAKRKIFMGDSGSMFIGFLLAYQAVSFLAYNTTALSPAVWVKAPIMAMAILSYPLLDTLRVFIIRIYHKRSPFSADRNHIHHRLLNLGFPHIKASLIIGCLNILAIVLALLIQELDINTQLPILVLAIPLLYASPWLLVRKEGRIHLVLPWGSKR
ncbi:undecaprenyl/decaprenyl-phosphate alpha-N-acetylglucosaminyl 1-phosphate transferase [Arenibacter aquaticus]|uniref:Undecaprenyl/decaprenyl-phosphate alpha-N-acetylglucosaminyl 1-phosphate transferase n=1 Tax=Arenibacter aquaticus TaxID=2489054 RepID=A0A3S0C430_9FLAO|nr:MraY family glycosyltransferase [Arenibacter aquaticus]RTE51732.1 undecaprenyl/decaprenyl-phosphate alpha-N-acetylglucosaminyl 1-phosphate transferase [Arenibacter aquaticus]